MQDEPENPTEKRDRITRNIVEVFDRRTLVAVFLLFIGVALVAYGHSQAYGRRGTRTFEIKDTTRSPLARAIGFATVAMGGLLIGLRCCVLEKNKRKILLLPGVCAAIILVLILVLGGPSGPASKVRPVPAELTGWRKEVFLPSSFDSEKTAEYRKLLEKALIAKRMNREDESKELLETAMKLKNGLLPTGLSVDSVRWRFTTIDTQGYCRGEAEVEVSWSGQKDMRGWLYGVLVDADGYEICRGLEEIEMEPKSRKLCQFSFGGYDDRLTVKRARAVKNMQLRFEETRY